MPKRSNAFQRAVRFIYQQLMGNTNVPESMYLVDRLTGKNREVDVVIEKDVADHHIVLSVECVGRSRPASVEWIEQMACKHQTLPTDHLVLISEAGFTPEAKEKAEKLGIETPTPDEALKVDWATVVGKLPNIYAARYTANTLNCRIECEQDHDPAVSMASGPTEILYGSEGKVLGTLDEIIQSVVRPLMGDIMRQIDEDSEKFLLVDVPCPDGSYFIDASGTTHRPKILHYTLRVVRFNTTAVALKHYNLKGSQVAFGELVPPFAQEGTLVVIEREGSPLSAEINAKLDNNNSFSG